MTEILNDDRKAENHVSRFHSSNISEISGSYLAHTQGKKHQSNLARRAAKEATDQPYMPLPQQVKVEPKKFVKIGRPGYKVYYLCHFFDTKP